MRDAFCNAMLGLVPGKDFVFLTGDLGFNALEPLRKAAGDRFINAGVAEQNMVSTAAGLAASGFHPWIYSIAPFIYARPFEQIRNDVCLHDLPVCLVGNGGGYAYGVMGPSHHALEDYGVLLTLPNIRVFIPAFDADVAPITRCIAALPHPAYLRLGRDEKPDDFRVPAYAAWRRIVQGPGPTILVMGPLAGGYLRFVAGLPENQRPNLWVVTELPFTSAELPAAFLSDLETVGTLAVVEEHVPNGGVGAALGLRLLQLGKAPRRWYHFAAQGYPSGTYGSQGFHRQESGLDPAGVWKAIQV